MPFTWNPGNRTCSVVISQLFFLPIHNGSMQLSCPHEFLVLLDWWSLNLPDVHSNPPFEWTLHCCYGLVAAVCKFLPEMIPFGSWTGHNRSTIASKETGNHCWEPTPLEKSCPVIPLPSAKLEILFIDLCYKWQYLLRKLYFLCHTFLIKFSTRHCHVWKDSRFAFTDACLLSKCLSAIRDLFLNHPMTDLVTCFKDSDLNTCLPYHQLLFLVLLSEVGLPVFCVAHLYPHIMYVMTGCVLSNSWMLVKLL